MKHSHKSKSTPPGNGYIHIPPKGKFGKIHRLKLVPKLVGVFSLNARLLKPDLETAFFLDQWLFLVPLKGGRWHIIPQLAVYTTYIPLIYCLLGGYMLPTTSQGNQKQPLI